MAMTTCPDSLPLLSKRIDGGLPVGENQILLNLSWTAPGSISRLGVSPGFYRENRG
jgi:hypothetical protein